MGSTIIENSSVAGYKASRSLDGEASIAETGGFKELFTKALMRNGTGSSVHKYPNLHKATPKATRKALLVNHAPILT